MHFVINGNKSDLLKVAALVNSGRTIFVAQRNGFDFW